MRTSGLTAYGTLAERFAPSFEQSDPIIVFDQGGAAEAVRDAVSRRLGGQQFFVRPILPNEAAIRSDAVAPTILSAFASLDERRVAFDQAFAGTLRVNDGLLGNVTAYTPQTLRLMQGALRLSDGVIASSQAERRRVQQLLGTQAPAEVWPLHDHSVPAATIPRAKPDAIVVWAPHLAGDVAALFPLALADLRIPIIIVSGSAPSSDMGFSWTTPADASNALARAKLILDTTSHGCDAVRALSAWQAPILADLESGATEFFHGVRTYDRTRYSSIIENALAAIGDVVASPRPISVATRPRPEIEGIFDGPLVSVVIPTLDRPRLLDLALESISRQTYRSIETIVVVDGGPRLDALAAKYPDVRFIYMPENNPLYSSNFAFAATGGEYVAFLNDDDVYFPNHISLLAGALERSGMTVAHGDVLTAFLEGSDDEWRLYGFESNMSRPVEFPGIMVSNQIGMTSAMFRRSAIEDDAPFEEAVPLYRDYALWARLAHRHDFIHVERITSCYTIRNKGAQQQSTMWFDKALASYEAVYRIYPMEGRPLIHTRRAQIIELVKQGQLGIGDAEPAGTITPVVWPPRT